MAVTENQARRASVADAPAEDRHFSAAHHAEVSGTTGESETPTSPELTVAPNQLNMSDIAATSGSAQQSGKIPSLKIGLMGGLVGMLCCVGPTVLAIVGVVSATTAHAWANDLYGNYAWLFRLGGLLVMAGLVAYTLKRKNQCTIEGARNSRKRIFMALGIAVGTYAFLYALTTWLGNLAT